MKSQTYIKLIIATLIVPGRSRAILLLFTFFTIAIQAQQPKMLMRLVAEGNLMQNETVVYFDSAATYNYDANYDAPSLGTNNGFLNIVTRLANIDYQVDAVPAIAQNMVIPVKITTGTSGTYSVYANDLQNLPEGAYVHLLDNYNNTDFDLRNGTNQYYISDTETVARFQLEVSVNMIHNVTTSSIDPTCATSANGAIHAMASGPGPFNYYWKDSLNNIIRAALNKGAADTLPAANAGTYRLDVTTPGTDNNATVYFKLQGSMSARAAFTIPSNTVNLYNGVANVYFTNTSVNAQSYTWDFGDGTGSTLTNPGHSYNQIGTYTITLTAGNTACSDLSVYKEIITINASMGLNMEQQVGIALGADGNGYFVRTTTGGGTLSVTDLLGRTLMNEVNVNGMPKIYLDPALPTNQVLVIRVNGPEQNTSIKFIKQ